jgi:hypothetical protein
MREYRLKLSTKEMSQLEELVKDLERGAQSIRAVERSYLEEPASVFRPTPAKLGGSPRRMRD